MLFNSDSLQRIDSFTSITNADSDIRIIDLYSVMSLSILYLYSPCHNWHLFKRTLLDYLFFPPDRFNKSISLFNLNYNQKASLFNQLDENNYDFLSESTGKHSVSTSSGYDFRFAYIDYLYVMTVLYITEQKHNWNLFRSTFKSLFFIDLEKDEMLLKMFITIYYANSFKYQTASLNSSYYRFF